MLKRILALGILSVFVSLGYAQESITITTYYPSPYGVYNELEVAKWVELNRTDFDTGELRLWTPTPAPNGSGWNLHNRGPNTILGGDNNKLYLTYFDGTSWSGPHLTITPTGNVGIGTTSPNYELDVNGALSLQPSSAPTGANGVIYYDSGSNRFRSYENGAWKDLGAVGAAAYWSLSGSNLFPDNTGWNVGIGTTSPAQRLHVDGNIKWGGANTLVTVRRGILLTDQGGSIELGGVIDEIPQSPYIDFLRNASINYSVRMQLTGDDALTIDDGGLYIKRPNMGEIQLASELNPNNINIEIKSTGGTPYIDFGNGNAVTPDYDARIVLNGDDELGIEGAHVSFSNNVNVGGQLYVGGTPKSFIIEHPLDPNKYLIHATLEGPEAGVYYRGIAQLKNGITEIQLPDYFEALTTTESRTIQLTSIDGFDKLAIKKVKGQQIYQGRFIVYSDNPHSEQGFNWEVKAIRKDVPPLMVEADKDKMIVMGEGPYTYYKELKE